MFIVNFISGIIIAAIGLAGIRFNGNIVHMFGQNNWFERKLGQGTTFYVFQFVAILVILFGFTMMISLHDELLDFIFSPLGDLLNS
jgi:hypothetical protein